ncbi:MAG: serine/threonine protein kinase [Acidobacteria bacterium]|nr:serine/threonine protein kinase [Acidobacteriota bacterium]
MLGSIFSGYKIIDRLGGGNTGIVYKAVDQNGRIVALKILANDLLISREKQARFLRESQAAVMLEHPSIAQLLEVGEYHNCSYFAMEFIEGKSFRDVIDSHPTGLPIDLFFETVEPVMSGLAYAHDMNLIHRDLKPENLRLTLDGLPKILDFGLVKFMDEDSKDDGGFKTLTGMVLGSARYMSPEQANAEPLDARTDVFSMGIIMYELLTGSNPFDARSPFVTMQRILTHNPVSAELVRPDAPLSLCAVISRCLAKEPDLRYDNAIQLQEALQSART